MNKILFCYHGGSCRDGFCCAWLAHTAFGSRVECLPVQYGETPPLDKAAGRDVIVADFSWPRAELVRLAEAAESLTVLDHHKTAQDELDGLELPNGRIHFDLRKSGARLTWELLSDPRMSGEIWHPLFAERHAPWLVDYTEDRDLWRHELPNSREVNAAIRVVPLTFYDWGVLHTRKPADLAPEGAGILKEQAMLVASAVKHAERIRFAGWIALAVNCTFYASEVGNELCQSVPFSVTWFERADGARVVQLRSRKPDGHNVGRLASAFGGGGHHHAAAVTLTPEQWADIVKPEDKP